MYLLLMVISMALGSGLLAGAIPKLQNPRRFILITLEYRVLPPVLARLYGWIVPMAELSLAILLMTGVEIQYSAIIAALLWFSFTIAVATNLARGRDLDCGCFGEAAHREIGWGLLIQDCIFIGAAIGLTALTWHWNALAPWSMFHLLGLIDLSGVDSSEATRVLPMSLVGLSLTVLAVSLVIIARHPWPTRQLRQQPQRDSKSYR